MRFAITVLTIIIEKLVMITAQTETNIVYFDKATCEKTTKKKHKISKFGQHSNPNKFMFLQLKNSKP